MKIRLLIILTCFYCHKLSAQEPKLILPIGHSLGVSSAVFSPDGKRLVTASLDNSVKIWDLPTGSLLANLRGHVDTVIIANYSPDGKVIVTTAQDGTVKLWNAITAELITDLEGHTGGVWVAQFSPDGKKIITTSENGDAKLWELSTGKLIANLTGHSQAIGIGFFSPTGKKIITASDDGTAKVWDVATGKMLLDLRDHRSPIWSADFSPDEKKIITGSTDSTAKIWNAESGALLVDIKDHQASVSGVDFSPDNKRFLTASDDGDVKLWNAESGILIANIKGKDVFRTKQPGHGPDILRAAEFSPDGTKILTVYRDSASRIWDGFTGKLHVDLKRGNEFVNSAAFSKDGKKISLALAFAHVEIYDVEKGNLVVDIRGDANAIIHFALNQDGSRILVSNWRGSAKLLDARTGGLVANFPANKGMAGASASFSPNGKKLVSFDHNNSAKVWDAITGSFLLELRGHKKPVYSASFTPNGKLIHTRSLDSTDKIWDASSGKILLDVKIAKGARNSKISPDSRKLAIAPFLDKTASIWDIETGKLIVELSGHEKPISNCHYSEDGRKLLTFARDSIIKIWDTETGKQLVSVKEQGPVFWALLTPDGRRIISTTQARLKKDQRTHLWNAASGDLIRDLPLLPYQVSTTFNPDSKSATSGTETGTIVIWDLETGKILSEIKKHTEAVIGIQFSPDKKKFSSCSQDGTVKIWDTETHKMLADLKEHSYRVMSARFSPDGKQVISVSGDYTAKVWDIERGVSLYTFVSVKQDDYLLLDKYYHFDGTPNARKLLYLTCGTEIIELDQVKDQLWVPNLAERILKGESIHAANLTDLNICNLTPVVEQTGHTASAYHFDILPRLGGLGTTRLYVNGIEVRSYQPAQLKKTGNKYSLLIDRSELVKYFVEGSENIVSVKALTAKNNISSRSASLLDRVKPGIESPPNLYALLVGVSDYKGSELDLKYASKDAIDIAAALELSAKKMLNTDGNEHVFIYKVHTETGRDKFPEKNSIRLLLNEIAGKTKPNDIFLIFFAGHGVLETSSAGGAEKSRFYFLTADASQATVSGAVKDVGISTDELSEWIKPQVMKAQKRILIFDACNSGQVIKELVNIGQDGKNLLASRGDEKGRQIKAIEKLNERSGMFILSASASNQKAYEMGKYNQGALTYSLLKAIKEQPNILEERKYLNISRWFNAAEKSVGELARETGARQQPQIVSTTNFNIGVVDDEVKNKIILPFEKRLFTRSDFRNMDLRVDNLKLRVLVDNELAELASTGSGGTFLYSPEYEGSNVYRVNCDYKQTGSEITASIILLKGESEIVSKFETKGTSGDLKGLAHQIVSTLLQQ